MTNEEALKVINRNLVVAIQDWDDPTNEYQREQAEGLQKAKEALEKQIPKKPLLVPFNESRLRTLKCPVCGSYELKKHCDDCGQLLDWS